VNRDWFQDGKGRKMPRIEILVSTQKECHIPKSRYIRAIQVGAALAEYRIPSVFHDDEGENISEKNKSYCELTAQYWAWKNLDADYYGFFHYRRYLSFAAEYPLRRDGTLPCRRWKAYTQQEDIKSGLGRYGLTDSRIESVVGRYDIITTLREPSDSTVYEQYCQFHHGNDLKRMLGILCRMYPRYRGAAAEYMRSRQFYFTNMYIMTKKEFFAYMEWLFPLLAEFEREWGHTGYSEQECRAPGFLAERLFGIYYTYTVHNRNVRCCELAYVIFSNTDTWPEVRPAYTGESVKIALTAEYSYVPYVAVLLQSILECASAQRDYDIVILHTGITADRQRVLCGMGRDNVSIRFCDITDHVKGLDLKVHHHLTKEVFSRYFLPEVLAGYDKVLYLDADTVVMRDVAGLYDTDVNGFYSAAVRDLDMVGCCRMDGRMREYVKKTVGMRRITDYFQGGVQLLNLAEIRKNYCCLDFVECTKRRSWKYLDQDVMNRMFQGRVRYLPQRWNVLMNWEYGGRSRMDIISRAPAALYRQYVRARENPGIIHYAGAYKPWDIPDCDFAQEFWDYARRTPYYESILYERVFAKTDGGVSGGVLSGRGGVLPGSGGVSGRGGVLPGSGGVPGRDGVLFGNRGMIGGGSRRIFRLRPTKLSIVVDMAGLNRLFPPGTLRRRIVRALCRNFL